MEVRALYFGAVLSICCALLASCRSRQSASEPSITFTKLPPAARGSPDKLFPIEGRVTGIEPAQKVVLFAKSGVWWVQPTEAQPYTDIHSDTKWRNVTHPGSAYAALLVTPQYRPPLTLDVLPKKGGAVIAIAVTKESMPAQVAGKTVHFSGYDWDVRDAASDRGGTRNLYDPANASVDRDGHLHLRISPTNGEWTSAEVALSRSLGYGSYRLTVRDISHLEPAAVFSAFTWDDRGPYREMDIEISRWGEPGNRNAQYVVQPYYVPANTVRFLAPPGPLIHLLRWTPGRVTFQTERASGNPRIVDEHTFSSGVPSPGQERIHINLYRFDNPTNPLRNECEVVIEKFEYLP